MVSWLEHRYFRPEASAAETSAGLGRLVDDLALDYFSYGLLRRPHGRGIDRNRTVFTNYPREWVDRYIRRHYLQIDPVCDVALRSGRPFFWGHGRFLRAFRKQQRRVFEEASAFRIMSGLSIRVCGAHGSLGVFNVIATDPNRLREGVRHEHERLLGAAFDTHDHVLKRIAEQTEFVAAPDLSIRERECLSWTLEGKTAEEVATILNLSVFTVNRYASNAACKLGCLNKYHAAVRAFRAGLI